jgi:Mrp family chromosome partitioning ATPase
MEPKETNEENIRIKDTLSKIKNRLKVGLLDVDIHGPNLAMMLGVEGKRLESAADNRILPVAVTKNLSLVSMSFLLQDT